MTTPTPTRYVVRFFDNDALEIDHIGPTGRRTGASLSGLSEAERAAVRQLAESARTMASVTGSVGAWQTEEVFGQPITVGWFRTREGERDAIRATIETAASA